MTGRSPKRSRISELSLENNELKQTVAAREIDLRSMNVYAAEQTAKADEYRQQLVRTRNVLFMVIAEHHADSSGRAAQQILKDVEQSLGLQLSTRTIEPRLISCPYHDGFYERLCGRCERDVLIAQLALTAVAAYEAMGPLEARLRSLERDLAEARQPKREKSSEPTRPVETGAETVAY